MGSGEATVWRRTPAGVGTESAVQSVQRASRILACFSREHPELGVTDLSRELGLHKSTVSRLLTALRDEELVAQVPGTGKYRLGTRVLTMAEVVLASLDLSVIATEEMRALADETGETVSLVVVRDGLCFDQHTVAGRHPVRVVRRAGQPVPLMTSAGGRVLAAFGADGVTLNGLSGAGASSENEGDLEAVRTRGYAVVRGEWMSDLLEIAAPVRDQLARIVAALTVSVPEYRATEATTESLLRGLLRSAHAISRSLGY